MKIIVNAGRSYLIDLKRAEKKKKDKGSIVQTTKKTWYSYIKTYTNKCLNWEIISEPYVFGSGVLMLVKGMDGSTFQVVS